MLSCAKYKTVFLCQNLERTKMETTGNSIRLYGPPIGINEQSSPFSNIFSSSGERGGSVVECRTPEREVRGSRPTAAVLCP